MSMGLVCTAFAGLRAASLSTNIEDTTWAYTYTGTWMTFETGLGILAANLAPLRILFIKMFPSLGTTRGGYSRNTDPRRTPRMHSSSPYVPPHHNPYERHEAMVSHGRSRNRDSDSFTSDRSQIPLKDVLQTREVRVDYDDVQAKNKYGIYEMR
jgi:hypothetical protein